MSVSPTVEGFRAAFRRPSLTLAEITWRWIVGATALALFLFGLFEYLNTLPVTNGELLMLRTRQPYLVWQAIAHMLRGSLNRIVMSWIVAGSTSRSALDHRRVSRPYRHRARVARILSSRHC